MKKMWMAMVSATFAHSALALSLGEITTLSSFGEPLRAQIAIPSYQPGELDELNIGLAEKAFFQDKGIDWVGAHDYMKFHLEVNSKNAPYIAVETSRPLHELNLGFLLKVSGSSSTIMRRYDVLVAAPNQSANVASTAVTQPRTGQNVVSTAVRVNRVEVSTSAPAMLRYGPVKRGEVLSVIAQKMRGNRRATLPQMVEAIFKQNPQAFLNGNIDELIVGSNLAIIDFAAAPPASSGVTQASAPVTVDTAASERPASTAQATEGASDSLRYGPVKKGDVLSVVAQQMRGDRNASLPQMIMAIYQQNPGAFLNDNINELVAGSELVIKDFASVKVNSKRDAIAFVEAQAQAWTGQKGRGDVSMVATLAVPPPSASEGRLTIEEVNSDDLGSNASVGQMAGVDSNVGGNTNTGSAVSLENELLVTEEEIQALRVENEDLLTRISNLENQLTQAAQGFVASAVEGVSILSKESTLYADDIALANSDIVVIEEQTLGVWGVLGMGLVMLGFVALAYLYVQRQRPEHDLPEIRFPSSSSAGVMSFWRRWRNG